MPNYISENIHTIQGFEVIVAISICLVTIKSKSCLGSRHLNLWHYAVSRVMVVVSSNRLILVVKSVKSSWNEFNNGKCHIFSECANIQIAKDSTKAVVNH